jgi:tRNA nucleotidyltransferase (CCA-adding enzyme)
VGEGHPGGLVEGLDSVRGGGCRDHPIHQRKRAVEAVVVDPVDAQRRVSADSSAGAVVGSLDGSTKR